MSSGNPHELSFPFPALPEPGERLPIVPGIDWVRLPLPFALDHVNCWYLSDAKQTCVIDSGLNTEVIRTCWDTVFAAVKRPDTLLVTHFHPDHSGLAGWFAESGCSVVSNAVEWGTVLRLHAIDDTAYGQLYADWYQRHGIASRYIEAVLAKGNTFAMGVASPPVLSGVLADGDTLEMSGKIFRVITGRGHAPDMLMLYCENDSLLIAADQVLPSISPNVSLMPHSEDDNPLLSFLDSLEQLRTLPVDTLVLPSHGLPFRGLHERIDQLLAHHQQRLDDIVAALSYAQPAAKLFGMLFKRELDDQQMSFALGETLAHLRFLEQQGRVQQSEHDSIVHFQTTAN